jgi:hypothetical protein
MSNITGNAPNQIPTNSDLGTMAFQDVDPYTDHFSNSAIISASATTIIDQYPIGQYRTSLYLVQAVNSAEVYGGTVLVTHNDINVNYEYTGNVGNILLGAGFGAAISDDYVTFQFTNEYGNDTQVIMTRNSLNAR